MVFWRCPECLTIERTEGPVDSVTHTHWNTDHRVQMRWALLACRTMHEAKSMVRVRRGNRVGMRRAPKAKPFKVGSFFDGMGR